MSRKRKEVEEVKEVKVETVEETPAVKVVPLKRALSVWRKKNPQRAMFLDDVEAVELYVKRYLPSLEATQEQFDELFCKY